MIRSNGDRELRDVIETHAEMGDLRWPIQLTLSNHETMTPPCFSGAPRSSRP
ncbi:MAG: hypothetical protein ACO33A_08395 [Hyphomonas sp.]